MCTDGSAHEADDPALCRATWAVWKGDWGRVSSYARWYLARLLGRGLGRGIGEESKGGKATSGPLGEQPGPPRTTQSEDACDADSVLVVWRSCSPLPPPVFSDT